MRKISFSLTFVLICLPILSDAGILDDLIKGIEILAPKNIQKVADVLRNVGFRKEVDDFILSMNRATEKAAPQATSYFVEAIKEMTFEDARKILHGGDTAATDYFKSKTFSKLYDAFKPVISASMDEVGVTHSVFGK